MKPDTFPQEQFRSNKAPIPQVFYELDDTYEPEEAKLGGGPSALILGFLVLVLAAELALAFYP